MTRKTTLHESIELRGSDIVLKVDGLAIGYVDGSKNHWAGHARLNWNKYRLVGPITKVYTSREAAANAVARYQARRFPLHVATEHLV